ncbi:MAG: trypsin-like peptidase domain-containing protein [Planctomycetes bacterium]|nr:trypsin-like peptidase domain-containing protein [Planctomycetota bacterium]
MSSLRVAALAGLSTLAACQTEVFGGKDTYSDPVQQRDWAQEKIDAGARKGDVYGLNQRDPTSEPVAALCEALLVVQPAPQSVACLPLVSYDLKTGKPWVSELGVATADSVARALAEKGFQGQTFATSDVALMLARTNVSRASYATLEGVAANAERIGADVVVFGTIRRRDRVGALDRDVLSCEIQAYEVAGKRIAASKRFELPSDDPSLRRAWDLAQAESPWMPDSRWGVPQATPALLSELQRAADELAAGLARTLDPARIEGATYVAPLDVQAFAPEFVTLRSAQAAFAAELAGRIEAAARAQGEVNWAEGVVLNDQPFPSLQAAEAWLTQLSEQFRASPAARLATSFGSLLSDALRARVQPAGRAVKDLAAVAPADRALVEGQLAQGGLPASSAAREVLRAAGIGLFVATRLERVGDAISIRADAYDLAQGASTASGSYVLPAALHAELARALAAGPRPPTAPSARVGGPSGWPAVYERVKSGVVHVTGSEGRGSGFVVGREGLVVTNDHVARGIGGNLSVTPEGGAPLAATVIASDPYWDLALLAVRGLPAAAHVFEFAEDAGVGAEVAVLGHPRDSAGWVLTPGHVSSVTESVATADGRTRGAIMYTSPTRAGSSGSPVLLADGRVAAVHSAGRVGQSLTDSGERTELTGFALGIPAREARRFVASAPRP